MSPLADLTLEDRDGVILAAVSGEVDASNANDLGGQIREALPNDATALVVDLTDTEYIDSAGLNLLFQLNVELRARQQALRIVIEPGSPVERVLKIVGFDSAVPTHTSRAEAMEDVS